MSVHATDFDSSFNPWGRWISTVQGHRYFKKHEDDANF